MLLFLSGAGTASADPIPPLVAGFSANQTSGFSPLTVQFTDTSTGTGIFSYMWNFGDGSPIGTYPDPIHTFTAESSTVYNVTLVVTNFETSSTASTFITVNVSGPPPEPPVAEFDADPDQGPSPLEVHFTDLSTGTPPLSYLWDFGDGGPVSTQENPVHIFTSDYTRTFPVTLTVTNTAGSSFVVHNVVVESSCPPAPGRHFNVTLPSGWNLFSTPILLDPDQAKLERLLRFSGDDCLIVLGWNDGSWFIPSGDYTLSPLDALYIKMKRAGIVSLYPSDEVSAPPTRVLDAGINLIGPAPAFTSGVFPAMPLDQALISIQEGANHGLGYLMVISPSLNQPGWGYARGGPVQDLLPYKGYWVVMQNAGTLIGFSTTPLPPEPALPIDPHTIPKWVNQLNGPPPVYVGDEDGRYEITMSSFCQQILPPPFPETEVWGYGGEAKDGVTGQPLGFVRNSPAPSFEAEKDIPVTVKWENQIEDPHLFAVDPTLHWANPNQMPHPIPPFNPYPPGYPDAQYPVPLVTHLHGAEVQSTSDGGPEQWFTSTGLHGMDYRTEEPTDPDSAVYIYPNSQQPATLWYHDHALGITRINVMSGLAGFYLLRDEDDPVGAVLPQGKYEVPLAIQDRVFLSDGSIFFPSVGNVPDVHPYWNPEFFGDTIMVNGMVWPNMNVDRAAYRFRLLDGSNARFYTLTLSNGMNFTQIGSDGGYLKTAAEQNELTIAPGERADILIDFSSLAPGTKVILMNDAPTPFPSGDAVDPATTGQIIQFTVTSGVGPGMPVLPAELNPTLNGTFPTLPDPVNTRILTLQEVVSPEDEPLEILLDGQKWMAPVSELPVQGTTEEWMIVNPTMDTHPIHLHLVQFQLVSRQAFDVDTYQTDWIALNGEPPLDHPTINVPNLTPYLLGSPSGPLPSETGWKDTVQMNPGEVTTIRIRWAQQDGDEYPFDPTIGPGYVWHCHIIDHEDNEMMRPYMVVA
nr:PKD domain-containing protein [Methanolinea mesophila]